MLSSLLVDKTHGETNVYVNFSTTIITAVVVAVLVEVVVVVVLVKSSLLQPPTSAGSVLFCDTIRYSRDTVVSDYLDVTFHLHFSFGICFLLGCWCVVVFGSVGYGVSAIVTVAVGHLSTECTATKSSASQR